MIIIVVKMLPVFAIESPIFRVPIMLSEDSVPDQREIVVDVDGEGREVLLYVLKIEAPKHMPSDFFLSVITLGLIELLNKVTNNPICLSDCLISGIVTSRTIRMMDE